MAFDLITGAGLGAGADYLQQVLERKIREASERQRLKNEQDRIAIDQQRATDDAAYRKMTADSLAEQRAATAALRNQQAADRLTSTLPIGAVLDQGAADTLRGGNLGALVRHDASALPSTAISGIAQAGPQGPRLMNVRLAPQAGHGEQDVYLGTAAQQQDAQRRQQVQSIIDDPNTPDAVRQYLMVSGGSKSSPPSTLFQSGDVPVYVRDANGNLTSKGSVPRGARIVSVGGARTKSGSTGGDNPQLPNGAAAYAISIARKHGGNYDAALQEAQQYIQTQTDHPTLNPSKFLAAVKAAMARPAGARGSMPGAGGASVFGAAGGGRTVKMQAPDGSVKDVPEAEVEHYKERGAKVVG